MKKWYVIDYTQLLCPYCVNTNLGRWLLNAQTPIGQKIVENEIGWGGERTNALKRFYNGEYAVPTMLVFEEEVFMNRITFTSKFLTVGAYDDFATYKFKKELLNVVEV